jgi:hypothetical protein
MEFVLAFVGAAEGDRQSLCHGCQSLSEICAAEHQKWPARAVDNQKVMCYPVYVP